MILANARWAAVCSVQEQGRPLGLRLAVVRVLPLGLPLAELSVR